MENNLALIISDPHFGIHDNSEVFLKYQKLTFNWIYSIAEKYNIKNIIVTGDINDKRKQVSQKIINEIKETLDPAYHWYFLCGNHDSYYKNTNKVNFLKNNFTSDKNYKCTIIDVETKEIKIGGTKCLFIPWINKENYDDTIEKIRKTKAKIAFSHLELAGFEMMKGVLSEKGQLSLTDLANFDKVISGHFHIKSVKNNIIYTGSPYELSWNDYGDEKGVFVVDLDNLDMKYHKNPYKLYHKIWIDKKFNYPEDLSTYTEKSIKIYLDVKRTLKVEKFINEISEICYRLDVIDNNIIIEDINELEIQNMDIEDIWEEYIEIMKDEGEITEEEKISINKIFKKVYNKALMLDE
jgi:DNA repair exonuclease SbcCD nuclease subunit